jgi:hypothetical protein
MMPSIPCNYLIHNCPKSGGPTVDFVWHPNEECVIASTVRRRNVSEVQGSAFLCLLMYCLLKVAYSLEVQ